MNYRLGFTEIEITIEREGHHIIVFIKIANKICKRFVNDFSVKLVVKKKINKK